MSSKNIFIPCGMEKFLKAAPWGGFFVSFQYVNSALLEAHIEEDGRKLLGESFKSKV
ncbi:MAG: hypothetical protein P8X55_02975 [Desulfosarcinaceae bacterium]